jgi:choline dehydrogenase
VILAGGCFNTPQILMLSGLGPRDHLQEIGIECVVDSPGVGRNLQDRYEVSVVSRMTSDFDLLRGATLEMPTKGQPPDKHLAQWREDGTGLYSSNGVVIGILKRSRPELAQPDLFIFGLPLRFLGYSVGYSRVPERNLFTWAILKAHTANQSGRVRLRSADPLDPPEINFHYFQEGKTPADAEDPDLQAILQGVKFVREIIGRAGHVIAEDEIYPKKETRSDEELKEWIKRVAWGHHACGTCRMGRSHDPQAVLDSEFRVLGAAAADGSRPPIRGLRVVDASIFWKIPGYFIVTNIYMASEKAADSILASWAT